LAKEIIQKHELRKFNPMLVNKIIPHT